MIETGRVGASLIEILVSLSLISVGMLGAVATQTMTIRSESYLVNFESCLNLSAAVVDRVGAEPELVEKYDQLKIDQSNTSNPISAASEIETRARSILAAMEDMGFKSASMLVEIVQNAPIDGISTLRLNVDWSEMGKAKRCSVATAI